MFYIPFFKYDIYNLFTSLIYSFFFLTDKLFSDLFNLTIMVINEGASAR
jgi:hypothetical protein